MWRRMLAGLVALGLVLIGGALLRGWLVPASRSDLAPEAYGLRLRLPWSPKAKVAVWFPAPGGDAWVRVERTVAEATPLAALRELAAGPAPGSGLEAALPLESRVTAVTLNDGVAVVSVEGFTPTEATVAAMARTLAPWASSVSVGSVKAQAPSAAGVTYLWRGLAVPVAADLPAGDDRPAAAVRRLLAGPAPAGIDPLPEGLSVESVTVKGDLAKVNFNLSPAVTQELVAGRWQFAPYAMSVVYTLTDIPGIKRVQFDFPHLPQEARRNCRTPLGVPLVRPDAEAGRAKEG